MTKKKRRTYDDDFRASTVLMLEAAGYPDKKGALTAVANNVGVAPRTISRWFNKECNPPPDNIVKEKKGELIEELESLAFKLVEAMGGAIEDAPLRELGTTFGIVVDKWQLLKGNANWRIEVIDLVNNGKVTIDDVKRELGDELASELFESSGIQSITS